MSRELEKEDADLEIDYIAIEIRICRKRKDMGLTQQKLEELARLEHSNISHIERGATGLGLPSIIRIANALDCSVDDLLCDSLEVSHDVYEKEASGILAGCTNLQKAFITESMLSLKEKMDKFNQKMNHTY